MGADYILNGRGHGDIVSRLLAVNGDPNALRPWAEGEGYDERTYTSVKNRSGVYEAVLTNAPTAIKKDDWKKFDDVAMRVAKEPMTAVSDLRRRGLVYNLTDPLATPLLMYNTVGDMSPATISMDPVRQSEYDRPEFDEAGLPIPVIHKDWYFTLRQILASRKPGGQALDTVGVTSASRRVGEEAEKFLIGVSDSYTFGGFTVYGYINHPNRNTAVLTLPTAVGWTGETLVNELLAMRQQSTNDKMYGDWAVYFSPNWDSYLDRDYSSAKGVNTLRQRISAVKGFASVETLYFLTGYQVILVRLSEETARMVVGMDVTNMQWESHGGFQINFKTMAILVPQVRADPDGNSGIVHGVAA